MSISDFFVSTEWLANHIGEPNLKIVDATVLYDPSLSKDGVDHLESGEPGYLESHIPGALFADLFDLNDSNSSIPFMFTQPQVFAEKVAKLGLSQDQQIIIYDRGSIVGANLPANFWASRLAWQLESIGIQQVKILEGGFAKWKKEKRPLESGKINYPEVKITSGPYRNLSATSQDVQEAIQDEQIMIIDCLSPDQYQGLDNPYGNDKAGHIPSSHNVFFASLGDFESGELLDEDSIKEHFQKIGALDADRKVICYCGFGIAATWIQYILKAIGKEDVQVYDGSLNDWHMKNLPVEVD